MAGGRSAAQWHRRGGKGRLPAARTAVRMASAQWAEVASHASSVMARTAILAVVPNMAVPRSGCDPIPPAADTFSAAPTDTTTPASAVRRSSPRVRSMGLLAGMPSTSLPSPPAPSRTAEAAAADLRPRRRCATRLGVQACVDATHSSVKSAVERILSGGSVVLMDS